MPTITVNTTSTDFGVLPADLSQYDTWVSQYIPSAETIYQDEDNLGNALLTLGNEFDGYLETYGYNSANLINSNEWQIVAGPYTDDFYGTFSSGSSVVSRVELHDSATGILATQSGNFDYAGYPGFAALEAGSSTTSFAVAVPNPATPSTDIDDLVSLSTTWNGSYWSGTISGYSRALSDPSDGQMVQVNIFETPTAISYAVNTPTTTGFLTLSVPTVDGVGLVVSDYDTNTQTDSLLISGFAYAASAVPAEEAFQSAMAGNDVISISGGGSLNVLGELANPQAAVSSVTLYDTAANVQANLGALETLAVDGKLASISLTDFGTPTISVTPAVADADAQALARIITAYDQAVLPCYAAGTRIATERGAVAVEQLRIGERVILAEGGTAPVVWLGHRRVDCRRHPRSADVRPVRIAAHAFGLGRPFRDVRLSPDHAVFCDGVLIPVRYLLNDATVRQEDVDEVTYWHVELPAHGVLLADGLPAESYLDTGNRAAFVECGAAAMAHPAFARAVWHRRGCAQLVTQGPTRDLVYRRLIAQALALGWCAADDGAGKVCWLPNALARIAA